MEPAILRDLVAASDPPSAHSLSFDARFAYLTLAYKRTGDTGLLEEIAALPATNHLLAHARHFDYDVPCESPEALVRHLLSSDAGPRTHLDTLRRSLAHFTGAMLADTRWIGDVVAYLPQAFRFSGSLFLQFGYDIGVAFPPDASLNGGHQHFAKYPRELLYYAIHELHHVGFMTYQPPPRIAELRTCADVLRLVEYCTQMEGMAVHAAKSRRAADGALDHDEDYVALSDDERMERLEAAYVADLAELHARGVMPVDDAVFAVIARMSGGDRLWYRVGARMAARIEDALGRDRLIGLIEKPPRAFCEIYWELA